jgi:hypothetical protein
MISILKKLPWHCTHMITIRQRWRIWKATRDMITTLAGTIENLEYKRDTHNDRMAAQTLEVLDNKLLKRLISAAMNCQGFSVVQKDTIAFLATIDQQKLMDYHQPWNALTWKHAYTLSPNPTCPLDVVDVSSSSPSSFILPPHPPHSLLDSPYFRSVPLPPSPIH